jgi:hypothetical protein
LSNTRFNDDAVAILSQMKSLQSLNLRQSKITSSGKDRLAKELPGCKIDWSLSRDRDRN